MDDVMVPRRSSGEPRGGPVDDLPEAQRKDLERWIDAAGTEVREEGALHKATSQLAQLAGADGCSILVPAGPDTLYVLAGPDLRTGEERIIAAGHHPEVVHAVASGEALLISDVTASELLWPVADTLTADGVISVAVAPLALAGVTAALRLTTRSRALTEANLTVLRAAAQLAEHRLQPGSATADDAATWRGLAEHLADAVVDVGLDGRVEACSGRLCEWAGITTGIDLTPRIDTTDGPSHGTIFSLLRGQAAREGVLAALVNRDGSRRAIRMWMIRLDGVVPRARVIVRQEDGDERETTMRMAIQSQLEQLERLRRRIKEVDSARAHFLSSSSHELKTPLTVIQTYLEILLTDLCDGLSEEQTTFLRIAYESVLRLRRLVIDLVDLAALESGKIHLRTGRVRVETVLGAVVDEMNPLAHRAGVVLEKPRITRTPDVRADADRVHQVVRNLVDNAIKYTPAGGRVQIRATQEEDTVAIAVTDTGIGVPKEHLARVFDGFVQARPPQCENGHGTGLGLAICHRIVRALGGRITAESVEGEGSVFTVHLPRWPQEGESR